MTKNDNIGDLIGAIAAVLVALVVSLTIVLSVTRTNHSNDYRVCVTAHAPEECKR